MITPAALFLVLLGPAAGSFAAVLADRLPRGEDVLAARSACRSCGTRLAARDLVPLVSFALARGRCRHCGAAIPPWLLHAEILGAGAGVLAVIAAAGDPLRMGLAALFLWTLLALALADLAWFRLPDVLNAALLAVALAMALAPVPAGLAAGPGAALAGGALAAGGAWVLKAGYRAVRGREGMGAGDVKLLAGLGAFAGPAALPVLLVLAAGGALAAAALGALAARRPGALSATRPLPFGAALAAAAAALWVLAQSGIDPRGLPL